MTAHCFLAAPQRSCGRWRGRHASAQASCTMLAASASCPVLKVCWSLCARRGNRRPFFSLIRHPSLSTNASKQWARLSLFPLLPRALLFAQRLDQSSHSSTRSAKASAVNLKHCGHESHACSTVGIRLNSRGWCCALSDKSQVQLNRLRRLGPVLILLHHRRPPLNRFKTDCRVANRSHVSCFPRCCMLAPLASVRARARAQSL